MSKEKINWDVWGIMTSLACAIHCAILPLMIGSLSILGINIIHNLAFETFMILLAFCIGSISLFHGYMKHHHRFTPFIFFLSGVMFLVAKQYWHEYELLLLPFAVLLIITAHLINLRLSRLAINSKERPGSQEMTG
ncbi:MAG: MerC domain-containing protein [Chitinophagales bacterium]